MRRPWEISRRTFLRGLGTAIALKLLEAMLPSVARASSSGAPPPRRMLVYYVPNGIQMAKWTPAGTGEDFVLSPTLSPLEPFRDDLLVLSGLDQAVATAGEDGGGDHGRGTGSYLTCVRVKKTDGADIQNGISMDQVAAGAIGGYTRFRSLELGIEPGPSVGNCDSGYSCAYTTNISWADGTTPLAKETSPQYLFDRLFGGVDPNETEEQRARRKRYKQSVLDFVKEDATRLQSRLGYTDRMKLDEYLTGIRELEIRLQQDDSSQGCAPGQKPEPTSDLVTRIRQMADLMVIAFRCDLTRVITFMQANALSNRTFPWLGISGGHHSISHHRNDPEKITKLEQIDRWEVEELAYLLGKMKAVQEVDGTLLDNSLVMFSSELADGNAHEHYGLPVVVAGSGGGVFRTGRHLAYEPGEPIANLYISMLDALGVYASSFGAEGDGPLGGLT